MLSTKTSENIVQVQNLNLIFHLQLHQPNTLRDVFVEALSHPLSIFSDSKQEKFHLLKDISFNINKGERVGLVGINGAGKTSLCRCIAGIYNPTSGSINVNGRVRALFDTSVGFFPELSGRENAILISKLMYPELDLKEEIQEALDFSEIGQFLDVPYKFYSNGMQVRLCLSLASMRSADLLILDEVFEGADQFFKEKIAKRFQKMIMSSGASIFISHSFDQIKAVCNRVLILSNGHIVFDGTPEDGEREFLNITRSIREISPSVNK